MKLINITNRFNIAVHAVLVLASSDDLRSSVKEIAADLSITQTYLTKVIQPLIKNDVIGTFRGKGGGILLKADPTALTFLDIFDVIEGELDRDYCILDQKICGSGHCLFNPFVAEANEKFIDMMRSYTVAAFIKKIS